MKATDTDRVIGEKVKAARLGNGLSQTDVAERMGMLGHPMTQTTVSKIEAGSRPVLVSEVLALQVVLARSRTDLLP